MNNIISVPAGKYRYYPVFVSGDMNMVGTFRAYGGSGNDIKVYVLDEMSFINWKNRHSAETLYNSGRETVGKINVALNPGKYYLIFDNTFSFISDKGINAHIELVPIE